jgi:anti-sigma factor RsiW
VKANILTLETAEHGRVELLLPWYVNATLPAGERAEVEAHLARCTRCKSELAFQTRLREWGDAPGVADDTALGWDALRRRIDSVKADGDPPRRSMRWWTGWPLAWGLQCVASLALVVVAVSLHREPYRALGAGSSVPTANALVVFQPSATEMQIRAALRATDARLVGGPTVMDAYLLQMPDAGAVALKRLRDQPGVAQVESLVSRNAP